MSSTLTERLSRRNIKPCASCDGSAFYGAHLGFEQMTGSRGHYFDLVICKQCGRTEMFVDNEPEQWVAWRIKQNEFVEFQTRDPRQGPFR